MMRLWPCLVLLGAIGACSKFSEEPGDGGVYDEAGADAGRESGPPDDAGADGDAGEADAGDDASGCVLFGTTATGIPPSWVVDTMGGDLSVRSVDGRACIEGAVAASGQRAAVTRDLTIPTSGQLTVKVDLKVAAATNAFGGWLVNIVTVACTTPQMQVSLEVIPGSGLAVEAAPATPASVVSLQSANAGVDFATLSLGFGGGTDVSVDYRGLTGSVSLPKPIANAKGCVLRVGAVASGNIPKVTADIAEVCVTSP